VKKNEFKNILNSIEFPEKSLNDNPKELIYILLLLKLNLYLK